MGNKIWNIAIGDVVKVQHSSSTNYISDFARKKPWVHPKFGCSINNTMKDLIVANIFKFDNIFPTPKGIIRALDFQKEEENLWYT